MGQDCTLDQTDPETFCYEFPDEALEMQETGWRGKPIGNVTLAYCTGLNFCPGP